MPKPVSWTTSGQVEDRVDDHVAGHVFPLVEGAAQRPLLDAAELVAGLERQLAVHVHLVPGDLVDPDHGLAFAQAVEPFPAPDRLLVDGQCGDLRLPLGQSP